jgi:N-acetylglucosaminyldiphosphoundecaprenol N-acetyl-beta-D-mannosaminyltransferase
LAGAEGIAERAAAVLQANHPGLRIVGTHHGYLDRAASEFVVADVNRSQPDVLVVGMGTPAQEHWIAEHGAVLNVKVVWAVGALFDYVAGAQTRSPRWMREHHLEWLGRLLQEPGRLAGRYLIGNPMFCLRVIRQRVSTVFVRR